jgi:phenylalanine-4-hydroxylase
MIQNEDNEVIYFETEGETALAYREKELIGHGTLRHHHGFRSPLGKLKGINLSIENMGSRDLQAYNFYDGKPISFEFESGITVDGLNVTGMRNLNGKLMLIQFTECTVTYKDEVLFSPDMGDFDMAVGQEILSAFAGAADYLSFKLEEHVVSSTTIKHTLSETEEKLLAQYQEVRDMRESKNISLERLSAIFEVVRSNHSNDWLLSLEIYELVGTDDSATSSDTLYATSTMLSTGFAKAVLEHLTTLKETRPEVSHLIKNGLELLEN